MVYGHVTFNAFNGKGNKSNEERRKQEIDKDITSWVVEKTWYETMRREKKVGVGRYEKKWMAESSDRNKEGVQLRSRPTHHSELSDATFTVNRDDLQSRLH